jgi:hypothetical protein
MPLYVAVYRCQKTDRIHVETTRAPDYWHAMQALPRWLYPDGKKLKRQGSPATFYNKGKAS